MGRRKSSPFGRSTSSWFNTVIWFLLSDGGLKLLDQAANWIRPCFRGLAVTRILVVSLVSFAVAADDLGLAGHSHIAAVMAGDTIHP